MSDALNDLLNKAKAVGVTPRQIQEQQVSFVYGSRNLEENSRITKQMVEEIDAKLTEKSAK